MPLLKAVGIVIKKADFGEQNRMLTVFTKEYGIIQAAAYGVKSIKNSKTVACEVLCFSEFELSKGKGDVYTVLQAQLRQSFYKISEDIKKFSLAVYLSDITYNALGYENKEEDLLSAFLNTLYALSFDMVDIKKAKYVYELRMMSILGYKPILTHCVKCGNINNIVGFSVKDGGLVCSECRGNAILLTKSVADAIDYIASSDIRKIFSFTVSEEVSKKLEIIAEEYVKCRLDMDFKTLTYLKNIMLSVI